MPFNAVVPKIRPSPEQPPGLLQAIITLTLSLAVTILTLSTLTLTPTLTQLAAWLSG